MTVRMLRNLLRRAFGYDETATTPALRTKVDDFVRTPDHINVVLDNDNRMAALDQRIKRVEELPDIIEMQPCRRLVENVERLLLPTPEM